MKINNSSQRKRKCLPAAIFVFLGMAILLISANVASAAPVTIVLKKNTTYDAIRTTEVSDSLGYLFSNITSKEFSAFFQNSGVRASNTKINQNAIIFYENGCIWVIKERSYLISGTSLLLKTSTTSQAKIPALVTSPPLPSPESLLILIREKNLKYFKRVLDTPGINVNAALEPSRVTPLIFASLEGSMEFVQELINKGAKTEQSAHDGTTPLIAAARNGHAGVIRMLLENGADLHARATQEKVTALFVAVEREHVSVVRELIENLPEEDAFLDEANKDGYNPLMIAVQRNNIDIVKTLLRKKANVHATLMRNKATALHIAAQENNPECIRLLVEAGADINCPDKEGVTPLMRAAQEGNLDVVKLLVELKADLNRSKNDSATALLLAVRHGKIPIIEFLIADERISFSYEHGVSLELVEALRYNSVEITVILFKNGKISLNYPVLEYAHSQFEKWSCTEGIGILESIEKHPCSLELAPADEELLEKLPSAELANADSCKKIFEEDFFTDTEENVVPKKPMSPLVAMVEVEVEKRPPTVKKRKKFKQTPVVLKQIGPCDSCTPPGISLIHELVSPDYLEEQYLAWQFILEQENQESNLPLFFDMHTKGPVRPKPYVIAYMNEVSLLLERKDYTGWVTFVPGQGIHSRNPGFSTLKQTLTAYLSAKRIRHEIPPNNSGRIIVYYEHGQPELVPEELALEEV